MVNDNIRVDVSAADDVGWDVLDAGVLLDSGVMGQHLSIHGLLGLRVACGRWDLAS